MLHFYWIRIRREERRTAVIVMMKGKSHDQPLWYVRPYASEKPTEDAKP